MEKYSGTKINIGIEYSPRKIDDFPVNRHESYSFDLSGLKGINKDEVQKILADHKKMESILQNSPKELAEIMNDILVGRYEDAKGKAKSIGLTEEDFKRESGGLILWLVFAVGLGIMLYPKHLR